MSVITYKQETAMQWITLYYNGDDADKMKKAKDGRQMRRFIRYANVLEEVRDERLVTLADTPERYVGMTPSGLIVMFENNR